MLAASYKLNQFRTEHLAWYERKLNKIIISVGKDRILDPSTTLWGMD